MDQWRDIQELITLPSVIWVGDTGKMVKDAPSEGRPFRRRLGWHSGGSHPSRCLHPILEDPGHVSATIHFRSPPLLPTQTWETTLVLGDDIGSWLLALSWTRPGCSSHGESIDKMALHPLFSLCHSAFQINRWMNGWKNKAYFFFLNGLLLVFGKPICDIYQN